MLSTLQVHKHSFSDPGKPDEEKKKRKKKKPLCVHSDTETTSTDSHNIHSSTDLINMLWHCHRYYHFIELLAHNEDCPCQTGPQSLRHDLQLCSLFRETRQDHSPQSMFYSSAPSSEKPDRTTVPRACFTALLPLQRNQTGPQSPEHVLQLCSLFRETRQDHSPQSMFYSSAPSSEKPDRTTVPRACFIALLPLQRNQTGPQSPEHVL